MDLKWALREEIKKNISQLSKKEKNVQSKAIHQIFLESMFYKKSKRIACYYADSHLEVETVPLIEKMLRDARMVLLPCIEKIEDGLAFHPIQDMDKDLIMGHWKIKQPDPTKTKKVKVSEIDAVIVPGMGFSLKGDRLGRGKGFYDRWLATLEAHTVKIGLAYEQQISSKIFSERHDIKVDVLITPQQLKMIHSAGAS